MYLDDLEFNEMKNYLEGVNMDIEIFQKFLGPFAELFCNATTCRWWNQRYNDTTNCSLGKGKIVLNKKGRCDSYQKKQTNKGKIK